MTEYCFEFSDNNGWKYKGILSAELDTNAVDDFFDLKGMMRGPSKFVVEVLGFIWTDENDEWHMKMRLKFPSGNKQVVGKSMERDCNETKMLQEMYKLPMTNKYWFKNPCGTLFGIMEIMEREDLILTKKVFKLDENIPN